MIPLNIRPRKCLNIPASYDLFNIQLLHIKIESKLLNNNKQSGKGYQPFSALAELSDVWVFLLVFNQFVFNNKKGMVNEPCPSYL
jgi:hypothetical protein